SCRPLSESFTLLDDRSDFFHTDLFAGPVSLLTIKNTEMLSCKPDFDRLQLPKTPNADTELIDNLRLTNHKAIGTDLRKPDFSDGPLHR
ncbi:MAG: hypothetical protein RBS57_17835, partial [Desulforhabdus sp.]|nr:hypothetical protein [Desulforhabdus sp.]